MGRGIHTTTQQHSTHHLRVTSHSIKAQYQMHCSQKHCTLRSVSKGTAINRLVGDELYHTWKEDKSRGQWQKATVLIAEFRGNQRDEWPGDWRVVEQETSGEWPWDSNWGLWLVSHGAGQLKLSSSGLLRGWGAIAEKANGIRNHAFFWGLHRGIPWKWQGKSHWRMAAGHQGSSSNDSLKAHKVQGNIWVWHFPSCPELLQPVDSNYVDWLKTWSSLDLMRLPAYICMTSE